MDWIKELAFEDHINVISELENRNVSHKIYLANRKDGWI